MNIKSENHLKGYINTIRIHKNRSGGSEIVFYAGMIRALKVAIRVSGKRIGYYIEILELRKVTASDIQKIFYTGMIRGLKEAITITKNMG